MLGPRALRLPEPVLELEEDGETPAESAPEAQPPAGATPAEQAADTDGESGAPLGEIVLEAAKSAMPSGLLDTLALHREPPFVFGADLGARLRRLAEIALVAIARETA